MRKSRPGDSHGVHGWTVVVLDMRFINDKGKLQQVGLFFYESKRQQV